MKNNDLPPRGPISIGTQLCPLQSKGGGITWASTPLAQVREINYCFVCKKLIFSTYGSSPGQLLLLKSAHKPLFSVLSAGSFFPAAMILVGLYRFLSLQMLKGYKAPFLVVGRSKSIASSPWGRSFTALVNGIEATLAFSESPLCSFHLHRSAMQHAFPTPSLPRAGQPSQQMDWPMDRQHGCCPTATQKCQPWCQPSPRAAVSIYLLFHVGRRVQFHSHCAATLLTCNPSLFSPPLSFLDSWVCAFCSTESHPSVASSQALM